MIIIEFRFKNQECIKRYVFNRTSQRLPGIKCKQERPITCDIYLADNSDVICTPFTEVEIEHLKRWFYRGLVTAMYPLTSTITIHSKKLQEVFEYGN